MTERNVTLLEWAGEGELYLGLQFPLGGESLRRALSFFVGRRPRWRPLLGKVEGEEKVDVVGSKKKTMFRVASSSSRERGSDQQAYL